MFKMFVGDSDNDMGYQDAQDVAIGAGLLLSRKNRKGEAIAGSTRIDVQPRGRGSKGWDVVIKAEDLARLLKMIAAKKKARKPAKLAVEQLSAR